MRTTFMRAMLSLAIAASGGAANAQGDAVHYRVKA